MTADQRLLDANWDRMRQSIERAASQYERTAEELRAISFDDHQGRRRSPDSIISQAALTADAGRTHADLMHRLATWAESINEVLQHGSASPSCGYKVTDPDLMCVLKPGHQLPQDGGMVVHMSSDGVTFL